ncbi:MAG: hypothetical protein DHS20C15_24740 [Planctomycetota bacterium]|nr:MAG: hypothetical protein DHS20C15_24740 [Planctomycetota bacterium]
MSFRSLVFLTALLTAASSLSAQDSKRLADQLVREAVSRQDHETWLWGGSLETTARVLDLLSRSPRRYNEVDGPFFRRAAQLVAAAVPEDPQLACEREAHRALALAGAVTGELVAAREQALHNLSVCSGAGGTRSFVELIAHWSFPAKNLKLDGVAASEDPASAVLTLDDPTSVAPPSFEDTRAWSRWARAMKLRGRLPTEHPDLPEPAPEDSLDELLDDLELVLAIHGLPRRDAGTEGPPPASVSPHVRVARSRTDALSAALDFLDREQNNGGFGLGAAIDPRPEPGITALCLSAAMSACEELGRERPDWIAEGLDYLLSLQKDSGAIYEHGVIVYTTSVALEALLDGGREADLPAVQRALEFLVDVQADEGEGYDAGADQHYGGIGYGGDERPDLSNTQIALEAAHRAGLASDSALFRKALVFLERNQNLAERSVQSWPRPEGGVYVSGNDGGATYMPGNSPAGENELGDDRYVARSYGSMTYALLKSYVFCGVPADDERVQAALAWVADNYVFDRNPGFKDREKAGDGLYYYYLTMGRSLRQLAPDGLPTEFGNTLPWRRDLRDALLLRQREDGSWLNESSARWYEGNPALCTGYALLSLATTR